MYLIFFVASGLWMLAVSVALLLDVVPNESIGRNTARVYGAIIGLLLVVAMAVNVALGTWEAWQ